MESLSRAAMHGDEKDTMEEARPAAFFPELRVKERFLCSLLHCDEVPQD